MRIPSPLSGLLSRARKSLFINFGLQAKFRRNPADQSFFRCAVLGVGYDRRRRGYLPWAEMLEDRLTPSPVVTNPGSQTNAEAATVSLAIAASDPGYTLTYNAVNLPLGLSINNGTGVIAGTIDYSAAEAFGGVYDTIVVVSDGHGKSTNTNFPWTIENTPLTPTPNTPSNQTSYAGQTVSLDLSASNPDGDQLTFEAYTTTSTVTVASTATTPTITLVADNITAIENVTDTGVVLGTFTDSNASDTASVFSGTYDEGNGTAPISVTIPGSNGVFTITGSPLFLNSGLFCTQLSILANDANVALALAEAQVAPVGGGVGGGPLNRAGGGPRQLDLHLRGCVSTRRSNIG